MRQSPAGFNPPRPAAVGPGPVTKETGSEGCLTDPLGRAAERLTRDMTARQQALGNQEASTFSEDGVLLRAPPPKGNPQPAPGSSPRAESQHRAHSALAGKRLSSQSPFQDGPAGKVKSEE